MSSNKLGDEGAKIFSEVLLRSNILVKLDLSSNLLTYKGA